MPFFLPLQEEIGIFLCTSQARDAILVKGVIAVFIKTVAYLKTGDRLKIVTQTEKPCFDVFLDVGGTRYRDAFNREEPYDRKTHVFYVPEDQLFDGMTLTLRLKKHRTGKRFSSYVFPFAPDFADAEKLAGEYDNGVLAVNSERETVADGVVCTRWTGEDKNGLPVNWFTLEIDAKKASLYVGTPGDGYAGVNVKAKVPEMIDAATANGVPVVAAVNADFFDMFGDCHPSGLCVKNGVAVANADSPRPFIGVKKDGTPVLTDLAESPGVVKELDHAAAGLQMIVRDGELYDFAPLEPFGYVRHPRTAAGVTKDGTVILLAVDGRIPEYSNGASLVDLARMMIDLGADRALNLDGGGSTVVYTKKDGGFVLHNCPADLIRPRAMLIRKEFNALLVTAK